MFIENIVNIHIKINFNFLNLGRKKILILNPLLQLIMNKNLVLKLLNSNQSFSLRGRHYSPTAIKNIFGKLNPNTNKSQTFT